MINQRLIEYVGNHTSPEIPVLAALNRETYLKQRMPQMLAGHVQGVLLRMISQMIRPRRILEIGTFTGYSAINLAFGLAAPPLIPPHSGTPPLAPPQKGRGTNFGILHTIEVNPEMDGIIRKYIKKAGLEDRIIVHYGEALKIIPTLDESWALVYIDADKGNYLNYYKMLIDKLRPGSFILADNALWDGKVVWDRKKMDKDTLGIVKFNEFVQKDKRVENMILPLRDGIMMVRKK
jgi:caffeoyl-CoA O-methyltransferase